MHAQVCDSLRMDGWTVDGARLRALREEAGIKVLPLADDLGCHHNHYRKLERGTAQPSPELGHKFLRVLTKALARPVRFTDFCRTVPSRRKSAA